MVVERAGFDIGILPGIPQIEHKLIARAVGVLVGEIVAKGVCVIPLPNYFS